MKRTRSMGSWVGLATMAGSCLLLVGCATATPYAGKNVTSLSDSELAAEYEAAAKGLNVSVEVGAIVAALKPDPSYVMTSSTNFYGGATFVSTSYATIRGTAQTTSTYYDQNTTARLVASIGQAIASIRAAAYRRRMIEIQAEVRRRIRSRHARVEDVLGEFFSEHPGMAGRRALVAAALPWITAQNPGRSPREVLEKTRAAILGMNRGPGLGGQWLGALVQVNRLPSGERSAFTSFIQVQAKQDGDVLQCAGLLGNGNKILAKGTIHGGGEVSGTVYNLTVGLESSFKGHYSDTRMDLDFESVRSNVPFTGRVVMLR
jgi:hypothetical protein